MSANQPQMTYYLVLGKQPPDVGGAMRPLAKLLQVTEDEVRQKLLTATFEVAARFARKANAEGMRGQLHALGIESFIVSDQDIRGHLILYAANASRGAGGVAFRDFSDKPLFCPFDDVGNIIVLEVPTQSGGTATLIDLHRRSTNITPRLDTALFDFSQVMQREGATHEDFLKEIGERTGAPIDRRYTQHREHLAAIAKDFASFPSQFEPPPAMLVAPYTRADLRGANIYSFLMHNRQATTA